MNRTPSWKPKNGAAKDSFIFVSLLPSGALGGCVTAASSLELQLYRQLVWACGVSLRDCQICTQKQYYYPSVCVRARQALRVVVPCGFFRVRLGM